VSPCNGQGDLEGRLSFRYRKEPWLPGVLQDIAKNHAQIHEVGCGQGTDGIYLCRHLAHDGQYVGIDYSEKSVEIAINSSLVVSEPLPVMPEFYQGNAEALPFEDDSIECIYSMGVIHHTPDTEKAAQEIRRVLKPNGKAYVFIYNVGSPKVGIAKFLRAFQSLVDRILGTRRIIYELILGRHLEGFLGTMLLECFGVPHMKWYRRSEVHKLFSGLTIKSLRPYGYNLPMFNQTGSGNARFGVFWFVELEKE